MQREQIAELFQLFESACYNEQGIEHWSARELQAVFQYKEWRNFYKVIDRAVEACKQVGEAESDHFVEVNKMVELGSGSQRTIKEIALTRYAAYLVAQNGDPSKPQVAFAQTYFAVQTRKQELIEKRLLEVDRVNAREKLSRSEKALSGIIFERGVDNRSFATIRSKGDQALFGGRTTQFMKDKLGVPSKRPLADFLPTLMIKAKDFAAELTSHNVVDKDLNGDQAIIEEHVTNNSEVRTILLNRGVTPENLPPAEDVKKIKRRMDSEEKKFLKRKQEGFCYSYELCYFEV